jgi:hypothetical protein
VAVAGVLAGILAIILPLVLFRVFAGMMAMFDADVDVDWSRAGMAVRGVVCGGATAASECNERHCDK